MWENGEFVGVVLFGQGATPELGKRFGIERTEICELTRVALNRHQAPVTRIIKVAIRMLCRHCPKIRLIISFADSAQGHVGTIYQAGNWLYAGESVRPRYRVNGELLHPKTLHSRYGRGGQSIPWLRANVDPCATREVAAVKHRYLMAIDPKLRSVIEQLRQEPPRRK